MKKLKILWVAVLSLLLAAFLLFEYMDEALPKGQQGPAADALAKKMLSAIHHEAWLQTGAISWGYDDRTYVWDRVRHLARVKYQSYSVLIDINQRKGFIESGAEELDESARQEVCLLAWKYWCNDSFWLNPVSKIFDPGTERRAVPWNNQEALLVSYTTGGNTPGDSYLWVLDENGLPAYWKLWVSIIPIGGMKFTWDQWVELETGVLISTHHFNPIKTIPILQPVGKSDLLSLVNTDIFRPLTSKEVELVSF